MGFVRVSWDGWEPGSRVGNSRTVRVFKREKRTERGGREEGGPAEGDLVGADEKARVKEIEAEARVLGPHLANGVHEKLPACRPSTMSDVVVPPEVTAEVTQILSNLVLGDNQIRSRSVPPTHRSHPLTLPLRSPVQKRPSMNASHRLQSSTSSQSLSLRPRPTQNW